MKKEGLLQSFRFSREIAFNQAPTLEIMAFEASSAPGECALKKMRHLPGHLPCDERAYEVLLGRRYGWRARSQPTLHPVCLGPVRSPTFASC